MRGLVQGAGGAAARGPDTGRRGLGWAVAAVAGAAFAFGCADRSVAVIHEAYPIGNLVELHLDQRAGDLTITGEKDREAVELIVELRTQRSAKRKDDEALDALRIGLVATGDRVAQILAGLDHAPGGYTIDVSVLVPDYVLMVVEDGPGDARIEGIASLTIDDAGGDLSIAHIRGDLDIVDESGDIDVRDIFGHVTVDDEAGAVAVANIVGDLSLTDGDGGIVVSKVIGNVTIEDGAGNIDVDGVGGRLRLTDGAGDIDVTGAADVVVVRDDSGEVRID